MRGRDVNWTQRCRSGPLGGEGLIDLRVHVRGTATALLVAVGLTCAGVLTPAAADDTVTVPGASFPTTSTYLTKFGCGSLYRADAADPVVRVVLDDAAPLGRRAAALDLPGQGTATGPVSLVDSVAATSSTLSVRAPEGATGVAWTWFVNGDLEPGQVWAGRADLTVPAGGWQRVEPSAAAYDWQKLDAATGEVLEEVAATTVADFTETRGDGPGYLLAGFGCDGAETVLDAIAVGAPGAVTTYDLEGTPVTTTAAASATRVTVGDPVTLTASTLDTAGVPVGAGLVLEARPAGAAGFRTVGEQVFPGPDGVVRTEVRPEVTTDYRWWFEERSYADEHASPVVRVEVEEQVQDQVEGRGASGRR